MPHQYTRELLSSEEGNCLINARETLRVLIRLDTVLRVSELAKLAKQDTLRQERRLAIHLISSDHPPSPGCPGDVCPRGREHTRVHAGVRSG
jgi:hypothetical protein